jgi:hypothetical protein
MKQLLKQAFCALLLLSSMSTKLIQSKGWNTSCNTFDSCNTDCGPRFNDNCNTDCKIDCDTGCDSSCDISNCSDDFTRSLNRNSRVHTKINYRSQGANTARELVGWQHAINLPDMCQSYGAMYLAFEYQRTFRPCRLAESIFGTQTLKFQGSGVENRDEDALVADYFGLPSTYNQNLSLCPRIENFIVDLGLYFGLDQWVQGGFFRLQTPLVHSRWDLFNSENKKNSCFRGSCPPQGSTVNPEDQLPACFIGQEGITANNLQTALSSGNNTDGQPCGANISFCRQDETKLADVDLILGMNFFNDQCYHLGLFLQYVAPTGNRLNGFDVFEPQIGNGRHHELGGGITAHATLWDDQQYQNLEVWLEGNATHMFRDCQCRAFDLCDNGAYSRYMLLRQLDTDGNPVADAPLRQARCTPLAYRQLDIKIDAKVDATLKFAYQNCNWVWDLGYNVYYQSEESISKGRNKESRNCSADNCSLDNCSDRNNCAVDCKTNCDTKCDTTCGGFNNCPFPTERTDRRYAVAGLTGQCCTNYTIEGTPYGCEVTANGTTPVSQARPSASMFDASSDVQIPVGEITAPTYGDTESVCLAYNSDQLTPGEDVGCYLDGTFRPVTSSGALQPINANTAINLRSGLAPSILTHKIFTHVNYIWADDCGWNPYLGLGAEAEFSSKNDDCRERCNETERLDLNQWGVWVKGGLSF